MIEINPLYVIGVILIILVAAGIVLEIRTNHIEEKCHQEYEGCEVYKCHYDEYPARETYRNRYLDCLLEEQNKLLKQNEFIEVYDNKGVKLNLSVEKSIKQIS